ncbi:MAG: hypothetical protein HRU17_05295 [Polyangiaceae bacterium]|nr:hypothetical protein [Polyangiaceae bacterium]
MSSLKQLRLLALLASLIVLSSTAYFNAGGSSNQNSRLDAIYAFVEPGNPETFTFRIDSFMINSKRNINTIDWAHHDGHYYSNKAPGTIWMGIPVYGALIATESLLELDWNHPLWVIANAYWINVGVSAFPVAMLAGALVFFLSALGLSAGRAFALALMVVLCTPLFPYSTQIWGHPTACAFSMFALLLAHRGTPGSVALAGLCAGVATTCDYLNVIPTVGTAALVLASNRRLVGHYVLGGALPAVALMAYHTVCFGGPLSTAAAASQAVFLDEERFLGMFGAVNPEALWQITFGLRRGILLQCPLLLLTAWGFFRWYGRNARDPLLWVCAGVASSYLLANSTFNGWHGGATVSARYLISSMPFWLLALKELPATRSARGLLVALGAWSAVNMLAIAAVNPLQPEKLPNPLYGTTYELFLAGHLTPFGRELRTIVYHADWPAYKIWTMFNWGQLMGLHGMTSLLPLFAMLATLGGAAVWVLRRGEQSASPVSE